MQIGGSGCRFDETLGIDKEAAWLVNPNSGTEYQLCCVAVGISLFSLPFSVPVPCSLVLRMRHMFSQTCNDVLQH